MSADGQEVSLKMNINMRGRKWHTTVKGNEVLLGLYVKWLRWGDSPAVQWLGLCASTAGGISSTLAGHLRARVALVAAKINTHTKLKFF